MARTVFVTVTTTDLARATAFYTALGFPVEPGLTGDRSTCLALGESLRLMVVPREFFASMTDKAVVDPAVAVQTALNVVCDSREEVDAIVARGLEAGGSEPRPAQDEDGAYARDLDDPDGNNIGFMVMAAG